MSLRDKIRALMPPTNRFFEQRIQDLELELQKLRTEAVELTATREKQDELILMLSRLMTSHYYDKAWNYSTLTYQDGAGRILLTGWYGEENYGDELMLRTVLEHMPKEALSRITVMLWDNFQYPRFSLDLRVNVIHYPTSTWELDALAQSFDTLVWGGGAIIDDTQVDSNPWNVNVGNLFVKLSQLMIAKGKHVYTLGLSANNSFIDMQYLKSLVEISNHCELFSVRDPLSAQLLINNGVSKDSIVECEDLVFGNKELNQALYSLRNPHNAIKLIAISPLCDKRKPEEYLPLVDAISEFPDFQDQSCRIALIPMRNIDNKDSDFCASIKNKAAHPEKIYIANYPYDLTHSELVTCDFHISYKYHAALISYMLGIPGIVVIDENNPHYANKMKHLVDLFACRENAISANSIEKLTSSQLGKLISQAKAPKDRADISAEQSIWLDRICKLIAHDAQQGLGL